MPEAFSTSPASFNPVMQGAGLYCNCGSVLGNLINCIRVHLETSSLKRKEVFRHGTQAVTEPRREHALDMWTLVLGFPGTAVMPTVNEKECLSLCS